MTIENAVRERINELARKNNITINKYNEIYSSMDNKKGIIYLDSGDYIEVKEE